MKCNGGYVVINFAVGKRMRDSSGDFHRRGNLSNKSTGYIIDTGE